LDHADLELVEFVAVASEIGGFVPVFRPASSHFGTLDTVSPG